MRARYENRHERRGAGQVARRNYNQSHDNQRSKAAPVLSIGAQNMSNEKRYRDWCDTLERQYDVMPRWYWNHSKRRQKFEDAMRTILEYKNEHQRPQ